MANDQPATPFGCAEYVELFVVVFDSLEIEPTFASYNMNDIDL